jgi:hypothetical protein
MSKKFTKGIFDNCAILFFILIFLILFVDRGPFGRIAFDEVE